MRIGIVNDSSVAVEALRRVIAAKPGYTIAWVARDGEQAVAMCAKDTPDLICMDLIMPGMDGVEATRRIMAATPCAILIVTFDIDANASRVFEAMGYGALDAVNTPRLDSGDALNIQPLMSKLEVIGTLIGDKPERRTLKNGAMSARHTYPLVAIGASAGGPAALATLLSGLPTNFSAAIVVIQHVDAQFAPGMADWLGQHSKLPVRLAREGEHPAPGAVLLAATGDHLTLTDTNRLGYTPIPRDYVYRPSVNVFFESVARFWPGNAVGVLLTGMGRDGALGLKALRDDGFHTIAQNEATCTVFGMPKAAIALGAASEVLSLECIASRLVSLCD